MHAPPDIDLTVWDACKAGDRQAYAHIYQVYYPRLYNYGYKFTTAAELIEDSIQEIFTQFWLNRRQLSAVRELRSYLFVSFRHYLLKLLSRSRTDYMDITDDMQPFALELSAEQALVQAEQDRRQLETLRQALQQLTPRQKEAVFFRYYENMSYEEIAGILHISVKATYKLVARAIDVLRETYRNEPLVSMALTAAGLAALLGSLQ